MAVTPPIEVQMLIRRPASVVFNAFADPAVTTKFWFTKSSGMLTEGSTLVWEWEMYAASTTVSVKKMLSAEQIVIEWNEPATTVVFEFHDQGNETTYVIIKNFGFALEGNALLKAVRDNTGGFTTVLDGAKAWLEHGLQLNLVADKFPASK